MMICGRGPQEDGRATARGRQVHPLVGPEIEILRRSCAPGFRALRLKLAAHTLRGSGQPLRIPRTRRCLGFRPYPQSSTAALTPVVSFLLARQVANVLFSVAPV